MGQTIDGITPLAEARAALAAAYDLSWSPAAEKDAAPIYATLRDTVPAIEWPLLAPTILTINRLKRERGAVILAHTYQSPAIYRGVADVTGDTVQLALAAKAASQRTIVQAGVRFMAETSKALAPDKTVLLPDDRAGCSLAASITPEDVSAMRAQYPDAPVIAHLNSSAAVKAASDICCNSSNALTVIQAVPGDTVILLPDQFLARNLAARTRKKIVTWGGSCEVHRAFSAADIADLRTAYPDAKITAHSQCRPEVTGAADFAGSASAMAAWVRETRPARVVMVAECSAADNLGGMAPDTVFLRGCNICPHMKRITLENILWSLHTMGGEIVLEPAVSAGAAQAINRMLELTGPA